MSDIVRSIIVNAGGKATQDPVDQAIEQYRLSDGLYADRASAAIPEDKKTYNEVYENLSDYNDNPSLRFAAAGTGGGLAGAVGGGLLGRVLGGRGGLAGGAVTGFGLGALGGMSLAYKQKTKYDHLSAEQKKKIIQKVVKKYNEEKDTPKNKVFGALEKAGPLESLGGLASMFTVPMLGLSALHGASKIAPMEDKVFEELMHNSGVGDKTIAIKPTIEKLPILSENAYFSELDKNNVQHKKNIAQGKTGLVTAASKRLWKPGIMAHELGHANIHASKDLAGFLQRKMYGPTMMANSLGLGVVPAAGAYALTNDEDSTLKGGLKGGLVGALANAGALVPEFEASRRGIKYMMNSSMSGKAKLLNSASLLPAFATYLISLAGPSAAVGAIHAILNKRKKKKEQPRHEQFLADRLNSPVLTRFSNPFLKS